jgi:peptidoglycan/LPS O-acetylase OafA/YrhL
MPADAGDGRDPRLDGLRGLAILLVVLYHATHYGIARTAAQRALTFVPSLGWSGVDLFFVLSGFLITGILLRARHGSRYYGPFYARRVLRIFPLYYAVLVFFLLIVPRIEAFAVADGFWSPGVEREGIWYWLYLSNVRAAWLGVWDHQMLSIAWSLAIEEHFYLLWPWVVRRASDRRLLAICAATAVGALALRAACVAAGTNPLVAYVLTPCRLDTLATGAAIAIVAARPDGLARLARVARVVLPVAMALFLLLCVWIRPAASEAGAPRQGFAAATAAALGFIGDPWMQTAGFTLLCAIYGALLVRVITAPAGAWSARLFEMGWLRSVGRVSYAMYLFHFFVATLVLGVYSPALYPRYFLIAVPAFWLLAIGTTWLLARLSWSAFEEPILRLKRHFPYRL